MPKTKSAKTKYKPVLVLPPLPPDQYEALRQNISVNGVLVPILVDGDGPCRKIIDGNYRKKIATELGYDCPEIVQSGLDEEEKRTLARALNLARRQLNTEQKRQLISDQLEETPDWSLRRIGKMLGVDGKTVASVRAELEATAEFPQSVRTVGLDGKSRPSTFVFNGGTAANPRPNTIATPPGICKFLFDLISPQYKVRTILDPSAGAGALTRPWKGTKVISYEILKGRDFFTCPNRIECDLTLCNPPFNSSDGESRFMPQLFLERIVKVVPKGAPIVLFTPMSMRLDQTTRSSRWRWLRDHCPPISGIISLPHDAFGADVKVHSEILLFNMPKLKPHYFLADKYLR
ncbi:MAG: hypothetical protein ABFC88_13475 [Thermoguttaceae bacterium]